MVRDGVIEGVVGIKSGAKVAAAAAGVAVTVVEAGVALAEIAGMSPDLLYFRHLQHLLETGVSPESDPLYRALNKIRNGCQWGDLTPEELQAVRDQFGDNVGRVER